MHSDTQMIKNSNNESHSDTKTIKKSGNSDTNDDPNLHKEWSTISFILEITWNRPPDSKMIKSLDLVFSEALKHKHLLNEPDEDQQILVILKWLKGWVNCNKLTNTNNV